MALRRRIRSASAALGAAANLAVAGAALAAVPAVMTAGLVGETARAGAKVARAAAGESLHVAKDVARVGARTLGTAVTGSDPMPDGHVRTLGGVVRGMMEPPLARHTRRVWADHGHVQVEVAAPAVEEQPEVRRALRRHLERLDGVQWATVNDVVGRVLVVIDDRRVCVEDVVGVVTAIEQARGGRKVFPQRVDHPADLEPLPRRGADRGGGRRGRGRRGHRQGAADPGGQPAHHADHGRCSTPSSGSRTASRRGSARSAPTSSSPAPARSCTR